MFLFLAIKLLTCPQQVTSDVSIIVALAQAMLAAQALEEEPPRARGCGRCGRRAPRGAWRP